MRRTLPSRKIGYAAALFMVIAATTLVVSCTNDTTGDAPETRPPPPPAPTARVALQSWPVPTGAPGSEPFPDEVRAELAKTLALRDAEYEPRTHHVREDGSPIYTNRLILETSPYLLQHAHNPVDWRPWGDEAFEEARRLGRPVFLSIGYSTCHWCHVMERESFEDEEIAAYMNANFIPIKVDREERPDVDQVYMAVVQMLTGGGGWPMTVVLTPDREPFFGGTYFPARKGDRGSRAGLLEILQALSTQYAGDPDAIAEQAKQITARLRAQSQPRKPETVPGATPILMTQASMAKTYDPEWGGFGRPPKFPRTVGLELLMRHGRRTGDPVALSHALGTLDHMAAGGIRDHVGGGFHRYATDREWLTPHFEKMLYDNALLVVAYLDAYQITGEERFADVARETLDYMRREMTSSEGAFYSATDADSPTPEGHQEEGWFFTWTPAEIIELVGEKRAALVASRYGVTEAGNFEGRNILHGARPVEEVARDAGLSVEETEAELAAARASLYDARGDRPPPIRDDKVLAAWNGLAVSAFARGARVLEKAGYAEAAAAAAHVVLGRMTKDGRLNRSYIDGKARHDAVLDDYAFFIAGLLDLYEASFDPRWLRAAIGLQGTLDSGFWDEGNGGYFMTSTDGEELLVRRKGIYDGARPSGNSVAASNLLRLYEFTTDEAYKSRAEKLFGAFALDLRTRPSRSPRLLSALDQYLDTPKEVILVLPGPDDEGLAPFLSVLAHQYLPNSIVALTVEGEPATALANLIPLVAGKIARDGRVTAYVCENRVCALPTTDPDLFAKQLATVRPYPN
ncbi:MAG: thioredoxin domain-containing protein [Candidatus Binatia bacterium]|nr:thioredoxin domain-containing protein [Candidatus Binatia bacterium]